MLFSRFLGKFVLSPAYHLKKEDVLHETNEAYLLCSGICISSFRADEICGPFDGFEQMGVPLSNFVYFFVALFEVMAGMLLIGRIFIHISLIPLIFIMLGALFFTKLPILTGDGIFAFLFASRLDLTLLILLIFLWSQRNEKEAFT